MMIFFLMVFRLFCLVIIAMISGRVAAIIAQSKYENQTIRIVLLGDSLIGRPYNNHDLSSKILGQIYPQSLAPYIELINSGRLLINLLPYFLKFLVFKICKYKRDNFSAVRISCSNTD